MCPTPDHAPQCPPARIRPLSRLRDCFRFTRAVPTRLCELPVGLRGGSSGDRRRRLDRMRRRSEATTQGRHGRPRAVILKWPASCDQRSAKGQFAELSQKRAQTRSSANEKARWLTQIQLYCCTWRVDGLVAPGSQPRGAMTTSNGSRNASQQSFAKIEIMCYIFLSADPSAYACIVEFELEDRVNTTCARPRNGKAEFLI
jgi:hypothetical protein